MYTHAFQVSLHDADPAGILFFAHLFRHAHDAYEAFMAAAGFPLHTALEGGRVLMPLVHAEADYLGPLRHGDRVLVELRVERIGRTSFTVGCEFRRHGKQIAARTRTVHTVVERTSFRPVPVPEPLRQALEPHLLPTDPPEPDGATGLATP